MQTRLNLLSVLDELQALGGGKVRRARSTTPTASPRRPPWPTRHYGIEPRAGDHVQPRGAGGPTTSSSTWRSSCGLQKVPPVVHRPRTRPSSTSWSARICTVSQQKRKKVGVLTTDAQLYGGFNMQTMAMSPNWPIIDELEKQYEVVQVDPSKPITEQVRRAAGRAALVAGPPRKWTTSWPRWRPASRRPSSRIRCRCCCEGAGHQRPAQPPGGMNPMIWRMQPPPKGDINKLWNLLGVDFADDQVVWQDYNPYPKASHVPARVRLRRPGLRRQGAVRLGRRSISPGLQQMLFPFPARRRS